MAVTAHVLPEFQVGMLESGFNLATDTIKVGLSNAAGPIGLASTGVSTAKSWADWKANVAAEITGTGYTAGGATLASETVTIGGTSNSVTTFNGANVSWSSATFTANQAIFYSSTAATYQLICFWDFGGSIPVTSGTFTLTINASGILTATAS